MDTHSTKLGDRRVEEGLEWLRHLANGSRQGLESRADVLYNVVNQTLGVSNACRVGQASEKGWDIGGQLDNISWNRL